MRIRFFSIISAVLFLNSPGQAMEMQELSFIELPPEIIWMIDQYLDQADKENFYQTEAYLQRIYTSFYKSTCSLLRMNFDECGYDFSSWPNVKILDINIKNVTGLSKLFNKGDALLAGGNFLTISRLTTLEDLTLRQCYFTQKDLRKLKTLPHLTHLTLDRCEDVTGGDIGALTKLTNLTRLSMVFDAGLYEYAKGLSEKHPRLERISPRLKNFVLLTITHLDLVNAELKVEDIPYLAMLTQLTHLHMPFAMYHLVAKGMELKKLCRVESFYGIWRTYFKEYRYNPKHAKIIRRSNAFLSAIGHLTNLKSLDLFACPLVLSNTIHHLENLTNLTSLNLGMTEYDHYLKNHFFPTENQSWLFEDPLKALTLKRLIEWKSIVEAGKNGYLLTGKKDTWRPVNSIVKW